MTANQPSWPRRWLMTDERIGDRLWQAIDRLPTGDGGVVFRHHGLSDAERLQLGLKVASIARERGLALAVSRSGELARQLAAGLVHNPTGENDLPISLAVHSEAEAQDARRREAALAFISPVYATRTHPGATFLGPERSAELARLATCPAIALGGMSEDRFEELARAFPGLFHGYAAIDCWLDAGPPRE